MKWETTSERTTNQKQSGAVTRILLSPNTMPQHSCQKRIMQPAHTLCSSKPNMCNRPTGNNPLIPGSIKPADGQIALYLYGNNPDLEWSGLRGTPAQIFRKSWDIEKNPMPAPKRPRLRTLKFKSIIKIKIFKKILSDMSNPGYCFNKIFGKTGGPLRACYNL